MVESLVIKEYSKNRFETLKEVLGKKSGYVIEDFHDIRVEIKKLNAISRILKFCYRPFKRRKFIDPYKKLFSCAGKIREAQLESALFEELQLTESLSSYLKNKNDRVEKDLNQFEKMAKITRKKINKHLDALEPCFNKITREKIYSFAIILNSQISSMISADEWTNEEIHELRKKLKELLYTINIFQFTGTDSKAIDSLQDLVGKWHDKVVIAVQLSNKKIYRKMNKQERVTMHLVVENLKRSSAQMFEKICEAIRKYEKRKSLLSARKHPQEKVNGVIAGL
jgi:CHAD domain-containing protein